MSGGRRHRHLLLAFYFQEIGLTRVTPDSSFLRPACPGGRYTLTHRHTQRHTQRHTHAVPDVDRDKRGKCVTCVAPCHRVSFFELVPFGVLLCVWRRSVERRVEREEGGGGGGDNELGLDASVFDAADLWRLICVGSITPSRDP